MGETFPIIDRRTLLRSGLYAGAGVAALASPARSQPGDSRPESSRPPSLVVDVALLADTLRMIPAPHLTPPPDLSAPVYGSTFIIEGLIFPPGEITEGDDPRSTPNVLGSWFCRGWLIFGDDRPEPHALVNQIHTFGGPLDENPFPVDTITSDGLEGTEWRPDGPQVSFLRTVTGGTGRYAGAHGTFRQRTVGFNATSAGPGGLLLENGPIFRCEFSLL